MSIKLTVEENPDRIKRYGHIKPAPIWRRNRCDVPCQGTSRSCTLEADHRGPHVAHGAFRRVLAVWDSGGRTREAETKVARRTGTVSRPGLKDEGQLSPLTALRNSVLRVAPDLESGLFLVFLLAMVAFVLDWTLRILGLR